MGVGRITVYLELPARGGLYRFANVSYRGVEVGKVTDIDIESIDRAQVTLSLDTSPKIPANLRAAVRSMSAIGEQYVDLQPLDDDAPYLQDGSVIPIEDTTIPQQIGPVLDHVSALVHSIPKEKLEGLLDETFEAFDGAGYDLGTLLDSSATLSTDLNGVADRTRTLIDDTVPFLDSQVQSADALRTWAHSLAGVTGQINQNDAEIRTLLERGPGFSDETSTLLDQLKPTLPILLANLTTLGQVAVTYNPSIEQLLVLLPPYVAAVQGYGRVDRNPTGQPLGEFAVTLADPPPCVVGFLPPSQWRNPADTTTIDTPDGLYCKLPQDSPLTVRGARNYPCMGHPGKRAPTVQLCNSDEPYQPLAMRQHALGPYPFDPNLAAQGVAPDGRVNEGERLYAPMEGTPPPDLGRLAPPPPTPSDGPPGQAPVVPRVAPSSYSPARQAPSVAAATYNPHTGEYLAPDGKWYRQAGLVDVSPASWQDLLPRS